MILYKYRKKILPAILLAPIGFILPVNAEVIWDSFYLEALQNENGFDSKERNQISDYTYNKQDIPKKNPKDSIKWKLVKGKHISKKPKWEVMKGLDINFEKSISGKFSSPNKTHIPKSYEEAQIFYRQIQPDDSDYYPPLRLSPAFPTANTLDLYDSQVKVFTLSSFSGGAANGTGNQNYAFIYDFQISEENLLSAFYSTADDPLYSKVRSQAKPNYWESYGASLKHSLFSANNLKIAIKGSLESWKVKSGPPNIFNNSHSVVSNQNLIGSISLPISWQSSKKVQITLLPSISFLPETQGNDYGVNRFYKNNFSAGAGVSWKPTTNLTLTSSTIFPLGPGDNSFNSNLNFEKNPIISFGANYDINPRIGLEGMVTNGFGATPATGILTLPSTNRLGYYAGVKYTPSGLDSPQRVLNSRENSISRGGITVNTALVPPEGSTQISGNVDSAGNIFGYIGHSISNSLQLDIIDIGSFNDVSINGSDARKDIVNTYLNDEGEKTRVGGKFIFLSPLRNSSIWTAARISGGRNRWLSGGQGYLFTELITTWQPTNKIAININPKLAWSGVGSPKGIGLGANIQLTKRFQLIPELNLVDTKNGDSNGTIGLRWLFNENINLDIYASSAAGLQDIGQLIGTDEPRLGTRFTIVY